MDQNIVVIYKEPKKNSEYLKMKNSNESFKEKLGGEIEKLDFEDFCIIYKKDSDNLLPNVYLKPKESGLVQGIKGALLCLARDKDTGKIISFTRENILNYGLMLNQSSHDYSNQDENGNFLNEKEQRKRELLKRLKAYNEKKRLENQVASENNNSNKDNNIGNNVKIVKVENNENTKEDQKNINQVSEDKTTGFFTIDLGLDPDEKITEDKKQTVYLSPKDENYIKAIIFLLTQIKKQLENL